VSSLFLFICTKTTVDTVIPSTTGNQIDFNRRVSGAFRTTNGGRLVVGDLKLRPNGHAIPNHLLCDGSAISRNQFPELFEFLGTSEGAGDGTSTFNLPNYLGAPLEVPATAPVQTVTESGTVSSGAPVTQPTEPGQTGGTDGGNITTGGKPSKEELQSTL
jgi:hypothetical protein